MIRPLKHSVLALLLGFATCSLGSCGAGGGGGSDPDVPVPPLVTGFSPEIAPYNFSTGLQAPVATNGALTLNTHPAFPGMAMVFFAAGVKLDPDSFFNGGDPLLGPHPDALSLGQHLPGVGIVSIPILVDVQVDHITLTPFTMPLASGAYTIRVGAAVRGADGRAIVQAPVLHTFHINGDSEGPLVRWVTPRWDDPPVPGGAGRPDIKIQCTEGVASASLSSLHLRVEDIGPTTPVRLSPAPGFPHLQVEDDGTTLPSNGHVIVWRSASPYPSGTTLRVTLHGTDTSSSKDVLADLVGNLQTRTQTATFETAP